MRTVDAALSLIRRRGGGRGPAGGGAEATHAGGDGGGRRVCATAAGHAKTDKEKRHEKRVKRLRKEERKKAREEKKKELQVVATDFPQAVNHLSEEELARQALIKAGLGTMTDDSAVRRSGGGEGVEGEGAEDRLGRASGAAVAGLPC